MSSFSETMGVLLICEQSKFMLFALLSVLSINLLLCVRLKLKKKQKEQVLTEGVAEIEHTQRLSLHGSCNEPEPRTRTDIPTELNSRVLDTTPRTPHTPHTAEPASQATDVQTAKNPVVKSYMAEPEIEKNPIKAAGSQYAANDPSQNTKDAPTPANRSVNSLTKPSPHPIKQSPIPTKKPKKGKTKRKPRRHDTADIPAPPSDHEGKTNTMVTAEKLEGIEKTQTREASDRKQPRKRATARTAEPTSQNQQVSKETKVKDPTCATQITEE